LRQSVESRKFEVVRYLVENGGDITASGYFFYGKKMNNILLYVNK